MLDYDRLAEEYARHRRLHPEVLKNLVETPGLDSTAMVLEVGCGTGNYIAAVEEATGASCWGVDPSAEMLATARAKSKTIDFQVGRGENLALLPTSFFDLVLSVDVIHHMEGRGQYVAEAHRLLKPSGWLCTVTDSEWVIRHRVPLTRYFPETVAYELERYPRMAEIHDYMTAAGFEDTHELTVDFAYQLTDAGAFRDKAFSSLHLIPEGAYQSGLERLEADLKHGPIQCTAWYTLVWGRKPQE